MNNDMNEAYTVSYKGKSTTINVFMLIKQGIIDNDEILEKILVTHFTRLVVLDRMEKCADDDVKKLRKFAKDIEDIDYTLQSLWGFEIDRNYHKFWKIPFCVCPNGDEYLGTSIRQINPKCPIHGV